MEGNNLSSARSVRQLAAREHRRLGRSGEGAAYRYLTRLGYRIDARNVRVGRGEIDIIAFDPQDRVLVFVEVKSARRRALDFPASMRAGYRKRRALVRAARAWVAAHGYEGGYRMDLVCVEAGIVTLHARELPW